MSLLRNSAFSTRVQNLYYFCMLSFKGVTKTFDGLAATPAVVEDYSKKAMDQVKSNLTKT